MKRKRVWRYYCDYCGKANCAKHHMKTHEKHCTMNPDRYCRMCDGATKPVRLKKTIDWVRENAVVDPEDTDYLALYDERTMIEIRRMVDDCPACILAVIRQSKLHPINLNFDYKKEAKKWLDEHAEEWFDQYE